MQRILSGEWRGMTLPGQTSSQTRPTTSLIRLAVFNIWSDRVEGARFLDLFSGTGAMGFEALSLGASYVTLVEKDRQALLGIHKNEAKLLSLFEDQKLTVYSQDVLKFLDRSKKETYDLIYIDPPYDWSPDKKRAKGHYVCALLEWLQPFVEEGSRVMIEQERHIKEPIGEIIGSFKHIESRVYGDSMLHHFEAFRLKQPTELEQDHL